MDSVIVVGTVEKWIRESRPHGWDGCGLAVHIRRGIRSPVRRALWTNREKLLESIHALSTGLSTQPDFGKGENDPPDMGVSNSNNCPTSPHPARFIHRNGALIHNSRQLSRLARPSRMPDMGVTGPDRRRNCPGSPRSGREMRPIRPIFRAGWLP